MTERVVSTVDGDELENLIQSRLKTVAEILVASKEHLNEEKISKAGLQKELDEALQSLSLAWFDLFPESQDIDVIAYGKRIAPLDHDIVEG